MSLTPSPSNAAEIAGMTLPVVQENYGVALDYSPASLKELDAIVDDLRRDQRFESLQTLLFSMGCYVGEVLVRHAGGRWRSTEDLGLGRAASSPIAVEMPDGRGCNPIARVYRRFQKGREDSLAAFFQAMAGTPPAEKPPE
ncbi:MAG TPA: DUF6278 family protein [Vicinamibacteria bacterium]|nr:DUF6278 family protein [Vicinamibacteria bacterium]